MASSSVTTRAVSLELPVQVREARLLTEQPWTRALGKLTMEVATEGWKFPAPLETVPPRPRVGGQTPRVSASQMYLWSCTWTRTGSRSASTQPARTLGSSSPWTGENSTAAHRPASRSRSSTARAYS